MSKLIIQAQYAHLISGFQATKETRYYLNGFCVQPHTKGGVLLVATDGHKMGVMHDADGVVELAPESTGDIWGLPKDILKACKPGRDEFPRWLVILATGNGHTHSATVVIHETAEGAEELAASNTACDLVLATSLVKPIDGTFPAWRKVLPSKDSIKPCGGTAFNANLLKPFAAVAAMDRDGTKAPNAILTMCETGDPGNPMVVLTTRTDFLGVLMPIRGSMDYPSWLD